MPAPILPELRIRAWIYLRRGRDGHGREKPDISGENLGQGWVGYSSESIRWYFSGIGYSTGYIGLKTPTISGENLSWSGTVSLYPGIFRASGTKPGTEGEA